VKGPLRELSIQPLIESSGSLGAAAITETGWWSRPGEVEIGLIGFELRSVSRPTHGFTTARVESKQVLGPWAAKRLSETST